MQIRSLTAAVAFALFACFGSSHTPVAADDTATLKVTFKLAGAAPAPKPLQVAGAFCGNLQVMDESLVVNPENKGVKNIFIHVYTGRGGTRLPKMKLEKKVVVLDNKNCRFEPHAIFLKKGDTLKVTNSDNTGHNVNIAFFKNKQMSVMVPKGNPVEFEMTDGELSPVPGTCNIHPWMTARVLVQDHPFAAISNDDGVCVIEGLPVGEELVFRANHEKQDSKFDKITIDGKTESWKSNRFKVTLQAGMNDLGTVELPW